MRQMLKNRNNIDLAAVIEQSGPEKLAFLVHGLGGIKEQIHIRAMAEVFKKHNYTVVTYDAANSIGESGGRMEDATLTSYFEDLEDVIQWASTQTWYRDPFVVAGRSLGGASCIMYAAKYPEKIRAIAPISAFVGGELFESHLDDDRREKWQKLGYELQESHSKPGVIKKVSWRFIEDAHNHDMRLLADKISCPALFITGSDDTGTPASDQQQIIDHMGSGAELHVIDGMAHNPRNEEHIAKLKQLVDDWLGRIDVH